MNYKESITKLLKSKKAEKTIIILSVIGIAFIFLSTYMDFGNKKEPETAAARTAEEYKKTLENELSEMISQIAGVGQSKIMVTLENGIEYVYVSEENKNVALSEDYSNESKLKKSQTDNSKESIIIVDSKNGGKEALIKTEIEPTIKGVLIICEGGADEAVKEEIKNVLSSLLNIPAKKISVSKLQI